jgi:threonyl-tRNA synthetase
MGEMISGIDFVKSNGIKKAIAVVVDGVASDLSTIFPATSTVEAITKDHPLALEIMRHTTSHIMAQAIKELYPNAKIAIGPVIENGFYYDLSCTHKFTPEDFSLIEARMREIIKANYKITRDTLSSEDAIKIFSEMNEIFKVELIQDLNVTEVTIYRHEDKFVDLCRGPHLPRTGEASQHFKLMKLAGAYWRGDSKREMLQRIYATSWFSKEDLDAHLVMLEEVEKRDHRRIGKEMNLFHMQEEAVGSVFWHPNGWTLYRTLKNYVRKCIQKDEYVEVCTPQMIDKCLWEASGHWEKFRQNMFISNSEDRVLAIKPMNCPGHVQIFKQGTRSYRDLPLRMAEFGSCHRNEPSGALYGIMRVRGFTQDDAHIFCTPEQVRSETKRFCNLLSKIYKALGFNEFSVKFSDRPEVRAGSDEIWDLAEDLLKKATTESGFEFTINKGEGAFYGPKLEFVLKDKLGREWQCGTLQVDFVMPERLGAWYTAEDGEKRHPIMLHRAVLGSLERFIGILLENYAGKLPMWLAPVQIVVATITNEYDSYAQKLFDAFISNGIRATLDVRSEKISYKIRGHSLTKVPIMAIIGSNEEKSNVVTLRKMDGSQETLDFSEAIDFMKKICREPEE